MSTVYSRVARGPLAGCAAAIALLSGCATPPKLTDAELASFGVRPGAPHWEATSSLSRQGYACFVSGAKREEFDCTKNTGILVSCVQRVRFVVDDQNRIVTVQAPEPACIGTP